MNYDVFISYSRSDKAVAERVCAALDKAGITYFIDRQGIGGGAEFPQVLAQAIVGCKKVLFLASANAYTSKYTEKEISFAFDRKEKGSILPYRIDESEIPLGLEFLFCNVNWRNIREHPVETVLVRDILLMLGRPPVSIRPASLKIGDYYHDNRREGIVFEVDRSGRRGKIMALRDLPATVEWGKRGQEGVQTGAADYKQGGRNLLEIRKFDNWEEKYPAFAGCAAQGEEWYLPARGELRKLFENRAALSGAAEQYGAPLAEEFYWSSSEDYPGCAWLVGLGFGDMLSYDISAPFRVRAVAAIELPGPDTGDE